MENMDTQIYTLDSGYTGKSEFAAIYLVKNGDRCFLVDNGVNASIPIIKKRLTEIFDAKTELEALSKIDALVLTHIHLDHAGATSQLIKMCPNAKVMAHPRARRHLENPAKLMNAVAAVYGQAESIRLYGEIVSIPPNRIQDLNDNQELTVAGTRLVIHHLRGHAKHHIGVFLPDKNAYFSGDSFGLTYPELFWAFQDGTERPVVIPSTSPSDFEYSEAIKSIDRIESVLLSANEMTAIPNPLVYPTHYGPHSRISEVAEELRKLLKAHEDVRILIGQVESIKTAATDPNVFNRLVKIAKTNLDEKIEETWVGMFGEGVPKSQMKRVLHELEFDIEINAQGLVVAAFPKQA